MEIQISHTSMEPIYEQIAAQIRLQIREGTLQAQDPLPSVRGFAREYRVSALTVKKAYDLLEEEGFVHTVHGKGTYVAEISANTVQEELQKQLESQFLQALAKARAMKMTEEEILDLVWGRDYFGELKIVDVNIRRLRLKIEDNAQNPIYITTIWGFGYKWGF